MTDLDNKTYIRSFLLNELHDLLNNRRQGPFSVEEIEAEIERRREIEDWKRWNRDLCHA